ncbi:hypothetical protein N2152v2_005325 [Parachlorella kessleri]
MESGTREASLQPAAKRARINGNTVAPMPYGSNLIEVDGKTCTHEVAWPPGEEGPSLPPGPRPGPPAKEYPFQIDPFQQTAINCLEAGHSVLVAAHTSAGKTVVAEYAFAMALRDKQRVIYTSPLKALSNQKYREFQEEFGDVGLMTGDVTINPNASCLVMTTEIFRSMLYRGSEVVREVQLVVYDEIHYLRDRERGVVWEESIILAPKTARFVFLSATIPNAREFAEWIAKIHRSPCHVVYTDYRPTPLEHFVFPAGGDGLYLGSFRDDNFQKAVAILNDAAVNNGGKGGGKGNKKAGGARNAQEGEGSDIQKIVKMVMDRNYDPVIVFSFSKKECEELARQMVALDLNDEEEKKLVDGVFHRQGRRQLRMLREMGVHMVPAIDVLNEDDRRLPQIQNALPMLRRGIGIHHSGLLPILKEVIEILFQEGLLKALFATETFSTGLNMPAKTVVFTNARKFDGGGFRWVSSGEYIQMSGRAGRRGLDDKGIVVLMLDSKMEPSIAKDMVRGAADTLYSEFHLEYNMLLNLLRVEGADPETLMRLSYRQFQTERALPALEARVARLEAERDGISIDEEERVGEYLALTQQLAKVRREMRRIVCAPKHALPFLQPGRLVRVLPPGEGEQAQQRHAAAGDDVPLAAAAAAALSAPLPDGNSARDGEEEEERAVWGAVINFERAGRQQQQEQHGGGTADGGGGGAEDEQDRKSRKKGRGAYLVDVLVSCTAESAQQQGGKRRAVPVAAGQAGGVPLVVPVSLEEVAALSSIRIYIPQDLRTQEARALGVKALSEVGKRFPKGVPVLDPEEDMKIEDDGFRKLQRKAESVEGLLEKHPLAASPTLRDRLRQLRHKQALHAAVRLARKEVKAAQSLVLLEDLRHRRKVLKRLGYVDADGLVTLKGRVASEIQTGEELVLAEMIFAGQFKELAHDQLCALVSCFVWREKSEAGNKVRPDMEAPYAALRETARRVGKVMADCGLPLDVEEYVDSFRPSLMDPVAAWCAGAKFADVLKASGVFEGSLVRAIRRLEELLRQLAGALKSVGDLDLATKFDEAIAKIKRDIIFAASLYL